MKRLLGIFIALFCAVIAGCDLQPKIASIPDDVGEFISNRYPTLLAEPDSDIYKTAVADYGMYASATEYGNGDVTENDYVLYSPADDYMMPAQDTEVPDDDAGMPDDEQDDETSSDAEEYYTPDTDVDDLKVPDYVNGKPVQEKQSEKVVEKPVEKIETKKTEKKSEPSDDKKTAEIMRAPLRDVVIERGDTLYSVSRKYSVPVNDLAVLNKISAPFALSVGQTIKVPDVLSVPAKSTASVSRVATTKTNSEPKMLNVKDVKKAETTVVKKTEPQKTTSGKSADVKQKTEIKTTKPETKKPEVKSTNKDATSKNTTKSDVKKSDVKQKTEPKKSDAKKTDAAPKADAKKSATKKTDNKKSDVKKTTPAKATTSDAKTTVQKTGQKTETKKRATKQLAARSSSKFSWPLRGKILSGFGSKPNGLVNDGINISGTRGSAVLAAENGFVAYAGNEVKGMGNLVIIQHADGWMTVYAHMDTMNVRRGSTVVVGQKIGTVGQSGKVDRPQLHFEIRKGTRAYNPISYLKK